MYLITFATTLSISLLIITPTHCIRTASSPKYLFSSESNILEGAFVASQDSNERFKRTSEEELQRESGHSRFRRAVDSQAPIVKPSQEFCEHEQLVIQWTSKNDRTTSNGNIVALCRSNKNDKSKTPLIFVSYDHGSNWKNVTNLFARADSNSALSIKNYYIVKEKPDFMIFPDGENNRIFYTNDGLKSVNVVKGLPFKPKDISINPDNPSLIIASNNRNIYLSKDGSKTYKLVKHFNEVTAYYWGMKKYGDKETDIFAEGKVSGSSKTSGCKVDCSAAYCKKPESLTHNAPLRGEITDFLVKNEYMFCTKQRDDKNGVDLYVKYLRSGDFVKAKIITPRPIRELFVYDVSGGVVMIVANLRKNETNLYTSVNVSGMEYSLSLPRVLYHNPHTDVSSHWLRQAVSHRFVDVLQVKSLPSVYFATQLTVGPVGGRYLISVVTFDKGGVWKPIRGPLKNNYGNPCLYPSCSLHINLFYGSIYRYSQTTPLMSRESAPGLIMTTGVLGANLKITPDTYISRNGGKSFEKVLRGKRHFAFGDHGGFVVASNFQTSQNLQYSYNFKTFQDVRMLSTPIQVKKILTEPGEKGVIFLVMGSVRGKWRVFQVNATQTLGPVCTKKDYALVNVSDLGVAGCVITQVKHRNATIRCLTGRNYARVIKTSYDNCRCRRPDYICDYKFKPSITSGDCQLIKGATLPIPNNCPEDSFYYQSQGYIKIKGRNCTDDNVTQSNYNPVKKPCPNKLSGLNITSEPGMDSKGVTIALNRILNLTATLGKGHLPRTIFTWSLDKNIVKTGSGRNFGSFSLKMTKPGYNFISLKVSNERNSIHNFVVVLVLRKIESGTMKIRYSPILPSVNEIVNFIAEFLPGTKTSEMGFLQYKWRISSNRKSIETNSSPILLTAFNKTGQTTVSVSVRNAVSEGFKAITFLVTKDLKVKNVKLSIRKGLILVRWDAVVEPLYNIRGYKVMYRKENDAFYSEANYKSGILECLISNVTAYTKYQVKVAVVAQNGYGPPSDLITIKTPPSLSSVPTKVKLIIEKSTEVVASWQPPALPNGKISGYTYKFYKNVKDAKVSTVLDPNVVTKTFSKLEVDVDYHFEVAVKNEVGIGPYSEAISVRTGVGKPTQPPTQLRVLEVTQKTAILTWNPPKIKKDSNIYFSPKGYLISTVIKGVKHLVNTTSDMQFSVTGLQPYTSYTYSIAAYVTKSQGPAAFIKFTTSMAPPEAPKDFTNISQSSTSVTFSWKAPPSKGGLIFRYKLYQLSPGAPKVVVETGIETQATVEQLKPYSTYVFAAKTVNEDTASSFSDNVSVRTDQDKPGAPFKVDVTDRWPTSSSVYVAWEPPVLPNGVITKYKITWRVSGQASFKAKIVSDVERMFLNIDHLKQETKYLFDVIAFTKVNAGPATKTYYTTRYYPFGSEHIIIPFEEPKTAEKLLKLKTFADDFFTIVQHMTHIPKERFADVRLNTTLNAVEFELISNERRRYSSSEIIHEMDNVKALLGPRFDASGSSDFTKANSVESAEQRPGRPSTSNSSNTSNTSKESSSSNTGVIVAIVCACAVIIAILVAALVIVFRRYRNTSMYNKFDSRVQYKNENTSPTADGEVEVHRPSRNYRHKDIESVPLADADELT